MFTGPSFSRRWWALSNVAAVRRQVRSTAMLRSGRQLAFQPPCADFGHFSPRVPDSLHIAAYLCVSAAKCWRAESSHSTANQAPAQASRTSDRRFRGKGGIGPRLWAQSIHRLRIWAGDVPPNASGCLVESHPAEVNSPSFDTSGREGGPSDDPAAAVGRCGPTDTRRVIQGGDEDLEAAGKGGFGRTSRGDDRRPKPRLRHRARDPAGGQRAGGHVGRGRLEPGLDDRLGGTAGEQRAHVADRAQQLQG